MTGNLRTPSSSLPARANASVRSRALGSIPATVQGLNSLDTEERRKALAEAIGSFEEGTVVRPQDTGWVNVLARTFFSYSADGSSPTRLAWEAAIRGLSVIGCADCDNLGALGEMLSAGDGLGVRAAVSLETRTYVQSYSDRELNCPGQPGVLRALGVGFTRVPALDSEHGRLVASLPARARERNLAVIARINEVLAPVSVDFDADVVPLTPAGNASFEHIVASYADKARVMFPELTALAVYWADVLGRSPTDAECLLGEEHSFIEVLGDKLARIGAADPQPQAHPGVTEFFQAVKASGAVPCLYWADGGSAGESEPERLLDDAVHWGARAVALHPDRLWNVADPEVKARRLAALSGIMAAARARCLPVLAGSPMSGPRQKFVDSFDAPELSAYFRDFSDAAFWLFGHTTLERAAGMGVGSEWARRVFGRDRAAANAFYLQVGKKAPTGRSTRARIAAVGSEAGPADVIEALQPLRI